MSNCTVPVTTVTNQVSFSLLWFLFRAIQDWGLAFNMPSVNFFPLTSFVGFQTGVAIV